jgi:hypothetical protein
MGNIVRAAVTVKGVRPLLFHHFGPEALPLEKQERTGVAGNDPEEWRRTVLATSDGRLYIEPTYVFSCLREGAKYTKTGRQTYQRKVSATLQVEGDLIFIKDRILPFGFEKPPETNPENPVYLDIRGVRNPTTRARNVRYRIACSTGWECDFSLLFDKTIVSRHVMEAILIDAGKLVGLGNGRAIGFGRFEIMHYSDSDC